MSPCLYHLAAVALVIISGAGLFAETAFAAEPAGPVPAGAAAHWTFNETSGTRAVDDTGNGNNAVFNHARDNSGFAWVAAGHKDGALSFPGGRNHYNCLGLARSSGLDMTTNDFTLAAWLKTSTTKNCTLMGKWTDNGVSGGYALCIMGSDNDGKLRFTCSDGHVTKTEGRMISISETTTAVNDDKWHHVALVRVSGGATKIYIDGMLKTTAGADGRVNLSASDVVFHLGTSGGYCMSVDEDSTIWGSYGGLLDETYVYTRALTDAEVAALSGL
jgi:alpha-L-arabinofuranosidase